MTNCAKFDLVTSRLDGSNLIEASAGTGKTYTIAGLYLRLIVEKKIPVEKILVVTFTEAATQELQERIRLRLKGAVSAVEKGDSEDPLLDTLIQASTNRAEDLEAIKDALRTFDQAAVFTIHGFCQRMLVENAFESGSLFETELVGSSNELVDEILKDFWRINMYETTPFFAGYLKSRHIGPLTFASFVNACLKPGIRVKPECSYADPATFEQKLSDAFSKCMLLWDKEKKTVSDIMLNDPWLNRQRFRKKSVPDWLAAMDDYFSGDASPFPVPEILEKFTSDHLSAPGSIKKNGTVPDHLFFNACSELFEKKGQLEERYESNILWYKIESAAYAAAELQLRKEEKGILGFDDLLMNLHTGLTGKNGGYLAENIRQKYSVALIDEFQDTDPIQYEIFFKIFGDSENSLFMIGDPKQAIYGFRGADIFAYMNASKDAGASFTLSDNYRSEPEIINAVNTLFSNRVDPFIFNRIEFLPAGAAVLDNRELLQIGDDNSFFNIWLLDAGEKPLTKGMASEMAPGVVTSEITRLLNLSGKGLAKLGSRRLKEQDIAVLVRTNSEAVVMKEHLNQSGVPAVIFSMGDVFHTHEAMELERILAAIVSPGSEGLVKAALVTDILGCKGAQFEEFEKNPERFERIKDTFRHYHELWVNYGFIRMFNALVETEDILVRLMSFRDGERRNTNFLHLSQLLQRASMEKKYGAERLLKWFAVQRESEDSGNEENQLRLESDANSVKIITIHKSKGMEYPVVFCPYIWSGKTAGRKSEYHIFHDKNDNMALTLDAGSDDFSESESVAETENLAEDLRLLYVALTRAKSRCYTLWGRVKGAENTAFAHLVHGDETGRVKLPDSDSDVKSVLDAVAAKSGGAVKILPVSEGAADCYQPVFDDKQALLRREFTAPVESDFKIASFSSLTSSAHKNVSGEDRDAITRDTPEKDTGRGNDIFAFPKGASPGTFMHSIFEHIDFMADTAEKIKLIEEKLVDYGFDLTWTETILKMVEAVLVKPLEKDAPGFNLAAVSVENRINELEFHFPLKAVSSKALNAVLKKHDSEFVFKAEDASHRSLKLDFSPVKGFMKGFIDLVFRVKNDGDDRYYIVDWKSNWLGDNVEDYNQANLSAVMLKEHYVLQYLLYSVALNRYLMLRIGDAYDYEKHFGGAFYIFLRGVTPDAENDFGLFFNKPSYAFISDLSHLLLAE